MRLIDADVLVEQMESDAEHMDNMTFKLATYAAINDINHQPTIDPQKWILCSERMPEEHDSIFSRFYGTEKWRDAMFRKTSDTVICTVQYRDGTRQTAPCHTIDGEWNQSMKGMGKVLAWMPLPEPWKGEEE